MCHRKAWPSQVHLGLGKGPALGCYGITRGKVACPPLARLSIYLRCPRNVDTAQCAAALFDDSLDRIHQRHRPLRHGRREIITTGAARRQRPALAHVRGRVTSRLKVVRLNLDSAVETQWDMRTKIALTIQLLIHGDFNCAAVETGESRKMSRCSRPQPTITFSATESFHNQLRNPG